MMVREIPGAPNRASGSVVPYDPRAFAQLMNRRRTPIIMYNPLASKMAVERNGGGYMGYVSTICSFASALTPDRWEHTMVVLDSATQVRSTDLFLSQAAGRKLSVKHFILQGGIRSTANVFEGAEAPRKIAGANGSASAYHELVSSIESRVVLVLTPLWQVLEPFKKSLGEFARQNGVKDLEIVEHPMFLIKGKE